MTPRWRFPSAADQRAAAALADELKIAPFLASFLVRVGSAEPDSAVRFLHPRLKNLSDPVLLPGIKEAVGCIFRAVDQRRKIVLYGDYDVDGVTSVALLTRVLRAYGIEPGRFLPHRVEEGYGLTREGVRRCLEAHRPQLLIALDCGTSAAAQIAELQAAGVEVIVIDHHETNDGVPRCTAFVNPKDPGAGASFRYLCTAGVTFKLCHALLRERRPAGFDLKDCLDLVAVGTVADLVPLIEENRILVAAGLQQLECTRWAGLQALKQVAAVPAAIRPVHVGFRLGPRLNAAGRLGAASDALDLLLCDDAIQAGRLARQLDLQNRERQKIEETTLRQALELATADGDPLERAAIVVGAKGWHPGVVGIVASRLARRFHRPTLVIGFGEDGSGKGSGRSISGFSLVKALEQCAGHLAAYGGHEMAAGLSLPFDALDRFSAQFLRIARASLDDEQLRPVLKVTSTVDGCDLENGLWQAHELLQPFGIGNPQPLLCLPEVWPAEQPRVMKAKHRLLKLRHHGQVLRAIHFNGAEALLPPPPWDVAFYLEANEYLGRVEPQIQVEAIRGAEPCGG
ncbi:MAG: single-stranded-DNA-specific exonuclease RecJ [Verrucomicrobia bacterium]|nr:single-stranded-DNA-specific exonuclease RecJ [Verrucomicrobiota bacterium]